MAPPQPAAEKKNVSRYIMILAQSKVHVREFDGNAKEEVNQ
jgi:hypothetical protein